MITDWQLLAVIPHGHRFFRHRSGKIAVADDSGNTPNDTHDGVLWLDQNAPLVLKNGSVTATVINQNQEIYHILCNDAEIAYLIRQHHMSFSIDNLRLRLQ